MWWLKKNEFLIFLEAQNASTSFEQGRLIYRFGGDVFGGFIQKSIQNAEFCIAPALFFDQTHDNPSFVEVMIFVNLTY